MGSNSKAKRDARRRAVPKQRRSMPQEGRRLAFVGAVRHMAAWSGPEVDEHTAVAAAVVESTLELNGQPLEDTSIDAIAATCREVLGSDVLRAALGLA